MNKMRQLNHVNNIKFISRQPGIYKKFKNIITFNEDFLTKEIKAGLLKSLPEKMFVRVSGRTESFKSRQRFNPSGLRFGRSPEVRLARLAKCQDPQGFCDFARGRSNCGTAEDRDRQSPLHCFNSARLKRCTGRNFQPNRNRSDSKHRSFDCLDRRHQRRNGCPCRWRLYLSALPAGRWRS